MRVVGSVEWHSGAEHLLIELSLDAKIAGMQRVAYVILRTELGLDLLKRLPRRRELRLERVDLKLQVIDRRIVILEPSGIRRDGVADGGQLGDVADEWQHDEERRYRRRNPKLTL